MEIFRALGEIMLYPIITFITDWLHICFFILTLPLLLLFVMSLFIVEPPEYLYSQKRYKECLESLNYIARFNGKEELASLEGVV